MESSLNYKPERVGPVVVEDLRKDLFAEFSKIPASQESVLLEKEHLQVYLRIRPFTSTESGFSESQNCISVEPPDTVVLKAPRTSLTARQTEKVGPQVAQRFQFSKVYAPDTTQRQIFDGTTKALVKGVLGGENALVFTYGVTNAGKTFTFLGPESDGGILPRSLNVIFNSIEERLYTQNNIKPHRCIDFTRLTKDQQDEEATVKKNLLRRFKENDLQKSTSSMSNSGCSTLLDASCGSSLDGDSVCLDDDSSVKFSIWVSFCEIYNENIHDLLDFVSNGSQKRSVLRLCQDVKGNTFVKDLTWVQVNSADEAYKVLKIGRKNQSFSSTKLNSVSSRSHSIFSIRILRIEDMGVPRIQAISELSLCDLAGSERCAKTQNRGERLKEAGNINTSLLTLGKCINAMRLNQTQSKFQQHIPFRESKLTHYLQGFFCGRGKACMIVNINQCVSMYDETLNVLKFSAVAQKVVVLNPKPTFPIMPKKSAREVSMMINNVDRKEWTRRSTLIGWETSLEDVQEDEGGDEEDMEVEGEEEEEEEEEGSDEESMLENTVLEAGEHQELFELQEKIKELKEQLSKEQCEKEAIESRIREEVTAEFMELFSNMEKDYSERLQREKEIAEERAERRLDILKNLVNKSDGEVSATEDTTKEDKMEFLDGMFEAMQNDLANIKSDAEAVQTCLESGVDSPATVSGLKKQLDEMAKELVKDQQLADIKTREMEAVKMELQKSKDQLLEANNNYENQTLRCHELMEICQEKDEIITKLQTAMDQNVKAAAQDKAFIDSIKEEILNYRNKCKCMINDGNNEKEDQEIQQLLKTIKEKDVCMEKLEQELHFLEQKIKDLTDEVTKQTCAHEATASLLEAERTTTANLTEENKALASELSAHQQATSDLTSKLKTMEIELNSQTATVAKLSAELQTTKALIKEHEEEWSSVVQSLKLEVESLQKKLKAQEISQGDKDKDRCTFQETIQSLRNECEAVVSAFKEKSKRVQVLEQEVTRATEEICHMQNKCSQLTQERDIQREKIRDALGRYEAERLAVEQIKDSNFELQAELDRLRQQLVTLEEQERASALSSSRARELEKKLAEREAQCSVLEERLLQTQNKLNQAEDTLRNERCKATEDEDKRCVEISKARDETEQRKREMEEELAHKDTELKTQAQEVLKTKQQVNDGLGKIRSLSLDLQQKDKLISDLNAKLSEGSSKMEDLKKKIESLTEEIRSLRQKLCDSEKARDEALANQEQTIKLLETEQACKARSQQNLKETCQELLQLKEKCERQGVPNPDHSLQEEKIERSARCQTTADKLESMLEGECTFSLAAQRPEKDGQDTVQPQEHSEGHAEMQCTAQDSSALSTGSERDRRFPKPELEISDSPLKPARLNIRKLGNEESATIKTRRTARKRKSEEMTKSVGSENRKNMRLRGNTRANVQSVESPTELAKKANQLMQQDSPVIMKGKKDGTLQKIGDFIQSSPNLLGSKAKKLIAKVAAKSPELQPTIETNNKHKRTKRKLFKTKISSPLDIPSQLIIGIDQDDKESDHHIIKRKLRTRTAK